MFERVVSRPATTKEQAQLLSAYKRQLEIYVESPELASQLLEIGESPFDPKLDPLESAALTAVSLGVLNLDEALTRE